MSFLTIFTCPKPFTQNPHIDVIQRNALQNWKALGPEVDVMMVGDEVGMAGAAQELGVRHIPNVATNQYGTPYVKSIFQLARESSDSPILCFANADMLFFPDLLAGIKAVSDQAQEFLIVGRRWDLDITKPFDFGPGWERRLETFLASEGKMHAPVGSDYFVFRRSQYTQIPDFVIGRPSWDNWMIYHGCKLGWPVIDATPSITIVHQNHDYSHLPGGKPPYGGVEGNQNIAHGLASTGGYYFYLLPDTNRQLRDGRIMRPKWSMPRLLRRFEVALGAVADQGWRWELTRRLKRLRQRLE